MGSTLELSPRKQNCKFSHITLWTLLLILSLWGSRSQTTLQIKQSRKVTSQSLFKISAYLSGLTKSSFPFILPQSQSSLCLSKTRGGLPSHQSATSSTAPPPPLTNLASFIKRYSLSILDPVYSLHSSQYNPLKNWVRTPHSSALHPPEASCLTQNNTEVLPEPPRPTRAVFWLHPPSSPYPLCCSLPEILAISYTETSTLAIALYSA